MARLMGPGMKISELTPGPGLVEVTGLVSESSVKETGGGKPFVRFTLVDGRASVACIRFNSDFAPRIGSVITVTATVDEFNGATQLKVVSFDTSDRDPSEFVPASAFSKYDLEPATERELTHMILSHHGQLDWGSPVTPKIIEAQLLHFIDNMDARSEMFRSAGAVPGEMTAEWIRPLGGRVTRVAQ